MRGIKREIEKWFCRLQSRFEAGSTQKGRKASRNKWSGAEVEQNVRGCGEKGRDKCFSLSVRLLPEESVMADWQPDPDGLARVVDLATNALNPANYQKTIDVRERKLEPKEW